MTTLMKTASLTALMLLFSGCNNLNSNLNTPLVKPKIDQTLETVDNKSIKSISDITSIAFEWKKSDDSRVTGYNFYRADALNDGSTLRLIKTLRNRYTTHFVDSDLEPETKYVYQISATTENGLESKTTDAYIAQTLPRMSAVSFVQAVSDLPNRIKILWRPHDNKTVEYYKIQKFNLTMNKWDTLTTVKGRLQAEYIDTGLKNSESCKYRVIAYDFKDVASKASETVVGTTKALPAAPTSVIATKDIARKIKVSWQASPTNDVIKYSIYRSPFRSIGFSEEKVVDKDTLSITDNVKEDEKSYFYKVYSVDKDGLYSEKKVDPTEGKTLGKPNKPVLTLVQLQDGKVILNWTPGDNRAISYTVYKKIKISFLEYKTVKFTNITDLRFEDNDVVSGTEYSYSIQSVDENNLISDLTDDATVTLPKIQTISQQ